MTEPALTLTRKLETARSYLVHIRNAAEAGRPTEGLAREALALIDADAPEPITDPDPHEWRAGDVAWWHAGNVTVSLVTQVRSLLWKVECHPSPNSAGPTYRYREVYESDLSRPARKCAPVQPIEMPAPSMLLREHAAMARRRAVIGDTEQFGGSDYEELSPRNAFALDAAFDLALRDMIEGIDARIVDPDTDATKAQEDVR